MRCPTRRSAPLLLTSSSASAPRSTAPAARPSPAPTSPSSLPVTPSCSLPAPSFDVPTLISSFGNRSLDVADLVALSGAHTFGIAHCPSFSDRFTPNIDFNPLIDPLFARRLRAKCAKDVPQGTANQTLDVRTPDVFDNKYYLDLIVRQGLFKSDQGLIDHPDTTLLAARFALIQSSFFSQFAKSMVKMSNMDLLTGTQGEIRQNCAVPNRRAEGIETANDEGHTATM
ncbi:unnamed protein product [Triticum turgidum subsp. durum]|uniref:peroxidase n=1 Tax=Triticum turgidum subsp. durum TaxID=4567 RepID=A0A9R1Q3S0_TRITD|nr:unnamed protein product [Triticum turgidum subsp. durum]